MVKLLFPLFLVLAVNADLWAQDLSQRTRRTKAPKSAKVQESTSLPISLNLGSHTEFVGFIQKNKEGGRNLFDFNPTIGIGTEISLSNRFAFMPELNWVLPFNGPKKLVKNLFMLRGDIAYNTTHLRLRGGTSLMWQNMHGQGGSVEMNNGNDTTTFFYPNENHSSLNNTLDFGVELLTFSPISLRLQSYVYSPFKEEKRQVSYSLFVTYTWGKTNE